MRKHILAGAALGLLVFALVVGAIYGHRALAAERFLNDYATTIPGSVAVGDTTIVLAPSSGQKILNAMIANPGDTIHLRVAGSDSHSGLSVIEYVEVTQVGGTGNDTITVSRGVDGSIAHAFSPGAAVTYIVSNAVLASLGGGGGGGTFDAGGVTVGQGLRIQTDGGALVNGPITLDITDGAITNPMLADGAVGQIVCNGGLSGGGVLPGAPTCSVATNGVTGVMLGVDAGSLGSIAGDASITGVCALPLTGTCDIEIAAGGVQSGNIASGAVGASQIANHSVAVLQLGLDAGSGGTITCNGGLTGSPSIPGGGTCAVATNGITGTMLGVDAGSLGAVAGDASITGVCSFPLTGTCDIEIASGGVASGNIANNAVQSAQLGMDAGGLLSISGDGGVLASCSSPGPACTIVQAQNWSPLQTGTWTFDGGVTVNAVVTVGTKATMQSAPSGSAVNLENTTVAGRQVLWFEDSNISTLLSGYRWGASHFQVLALAGNGTSIAGTSQGLLTVAVGTIASPALSGTAPQTTLQHINLTSAAGTNSNAEICSGSSACSTGNIRGLVMRGNATNAGGWFITWVVSTETNTANTSAFVGLRTAATFGTDPSAYNDSVGFGYTTAVAAGGDWNLYNRDTATTVTTDMTSACARDTTSVLQFTLYAPPNNASFVGYRAYNLSTNALCAEGTVTTHLPTNTVFMAVDAYMDTNGTSTAQVLDIYKIEGDLATGVF